MTFTEAAMEVLRSAGEPLHFKKITELAIERNLLSHVGKTPEVTMSSRLATLVKKDRSETRIVKVRPGVFAFREHSMTRDREAAAATPGEAGEAQVVTAKPERPPLPGSDVFPAEADDDDPILAGLDEASNAAEESGGRRRRRRRRRGKGAEGDSVSVGPNGNGNGNGHGVVREEAREPREPREAREAREGGAQRDARDHRDHRAQRDFRDRDHRDRDRDRDRNRHAEPSVDLNREPGDGDLLGKDLAEAAYHVLSRGDRSPTSFARIAEQLVRRGRLTGSPEALAPTVAASLRADVARGTQRGSRSRFRIAQQRVSLTEWLLPREALRYEEQASQSAERQRDQVRRAFMQRLNDLPIAGFAEIIATWLNTEGITALRAVRRPGSSVRELHFAGTRRRGTEETRLAIVVQRAGRDLDRETVIATRGSLHHYASATSTWLITTGRVTSGAREEAVAEGSAPCALFEGVELAQAMERAGIGIRQYQVALCDIDLDLLDALGDTGETRTHPRDEGRDRDRERNRRDDRGHDRMRGRDRDRDQGRNAMSSGSERAALSPTDSETTDGEAAEDVEEAEIESRETDIFELRGEDGEGSDLSSTEDSDQGGEDDADLDGDGEGDGETEGDYAQARDEDEPSDDEAESDDSDDDDGSDDDDEDEDDERDSR